MINRPDRPLGKIQRSRRGVDHPDRAAHLQERADGAHAEFEDGLNERRFGSETANDEATSEEDASEEDASEKSANDEDEPRR